MKIETLEDLIPYTQPGPQPQVHLLYGLATFLEPERYLEIGTWAGACAGAVLLAAEHAGFDCKVDIVDPEPQEEIRDILARFSGKIELHRRMSQQGIPEGPYDLALIDGDHSYASVKQDWLLVKERMSLTGIVCMHDTITCVGPMYLERRIRRYDPEWSIVNLRSNAGMAILSRNWKLVAPTVMFMGDAPPPPEVTEMYKERYQEMASGK